MNKLLLVLVLYLPGCITKTLTKDVISAGNSEECLWLRRVTTTNGITDSHKLFYCCPNRKKDKYQPVCVENFFVYEGRTKDWDR